MQKAVYILANFGGPRSLKEIEIFLQELLLDPAVIRPKLPKIIHQWMFRRIAKKRAVTVAKDYEKIGGYSPIYQYTEELAKILQGRLQDEVVPFHRYLPETHQDFLQKISAVQRKEIRVFPLFPQYSRSTTGSIDAFFTRYLPTVKMRWLWSYAVNPHFLHAYETIIRQCLDSNNFAEKETLLLFSCHGLPKAYIEEGDPYQKECEASFHYLQKSFFKAVSYLSYQSRFGPEEWLQPYTEEFCQKIEEKRKKIVVVPLSFTSDHIETLFEIEELYIPILRKRGFEAVRCPALQMHPVWIDGIVSMVEEYFYGKILQRSCSE